MKEVIGMTNALRVAKAVVMLAIVAFIVLVVGGVFMALEAAPGYTLATSTPDEGAESADDMSLAPDDAAVDAPDVESIGATAVDAGSSMENTSAPAQLESTGNASSTAGQPDTNPSSKPSDAKSNAGSTASPVQATAPAVKPSDPPAASEPQKTYHPARDEYIEEGHWEAVTTPGTYGQREVYGSVCNECGTDISGRAAQHLKETHHSGYHEGVVGYEEYQITPERTEQVWVDTSHWVHHDEYWG
jgi:hypothetical protein